VTSPVTDGAGARFVGQRVERREDLRLVTGHGAYVDDLVLPGVLHAAFVRSPVARGRVTRLDTAAARAVPGVVAVLTAADLDGLVQASWVDYEGPPGPTPSRPFRVLAGQDVRFAGEPLAVVVAESRYLAEDGVDAVEVDIDADTPVLDMETALDPATPLVHPELGSNQTSVVSAPEDPELDAVFATAPHVVTETYRQHRHACVPMETRGIAASWDPYRQELQVWCSTQGPHGVRTLLARMLGLADNRVRVVMPDVGGGFGQKMFLIPDEIAAVLAARVLGRPVKWIEDRRENLLSGLHAREDRVTVGLALDDDGRILAARADFLTNAGAFPVAGSTSNAFAAKVFPGPYRIPRYRATGRTVYTNTAGRGAYRGPWMVETVAREQIMDRAAAALGVDPLELRRRNVITAADLPHTTAAGLVYDQLSADATLEQAAAMIGYDDFRAEQRAARAEGRHLGIGVSLFTEPSGLASGTMATEAATVRIGFNGDVEVVTSSASHGQSLETTIAQVVADALDVDIDRVTVHQGDTATAPYGPGTGGSRSAVLSSGSARQAALEVRDQILRIAAERLEAAVEDLRIHRGHISVVGSPTHGLPLSEVARVAYSQLAGLPAGAAPGLEAHARYSPSSPFTWSNACHICTCEIDVVTGAVALLRYVVSEDCGVMINPNVVEGQIAGGVVQGIGGVLYEHFVYDDDGNPLTTTFVDYLLPTTTEVPVIEYGHIETPAPTNPGGHKGLGEGGAIGAPPAVANAVADALAPFGVRVATQPLGPAQIVALLEAAR